MAGDIQATSVRFHNSGVSAAGGVSGATEPSGSSALMRSYYDPQSNKTYALFKMVEGRKVYVPLTEQQWIHIAGHARTIISQQPDKRYYAIDLDRSRVIGSGENGLHTFKISGEFPEAYDAFATLKAELVKLGHTISDDAATAAELHPRREVRLGVKIAFAEVEDEGLSLEELARDEASRARVTGNALDDFIDAKLDQLRAKREQLLHLNQPENQGELRKVQEQLSVLENEEYKKTLQVATSLTGELPRVEGEPDFAPFLQAACAAKRTLLEHLGHANAAPEQRRVILERATDLAALLIPSKIGGMSTDHVVDIFYRGGRELLFCESADYVAAFSLSREEAPSNTSFPPEGFAPVERPISTKHAFLSDVLYEFHASLATPPAPADGPAEPDGEE